MPEKEMTATQSSVSIERLTELERRTIPAPWFHIGDEVSKPEVDIVRWAYSGMPPSEWKDATEHAERVCVFIAETRNALPVLLEAVHAAREFVRVDASGEVNLEWSEALARLRVAVAPFLSQATTEGVAS